MRLVLRGKFPGLNEYIRIERTPKVGPHLAAKFKREMTEFVYWEAKRQAFPTVEGPVKVRCYWYLANRRQDLDNARFPIKVIMDGLVLAGVLPNDSMRYVRALEDWLAVDRENPRVEVELERINEG
jgi:hypothetical protein